MTDDANADTSASTGPVGGSQVRQVVEAAATPVAMGLASLVLALGGVRRLDGSGTGSSRIDPKNWMTMICGAAAIVALVAVVLNFAALVDALTNQPFYSVYNHIGS